jgi:hypothetical protein
MLLVADPVQGAKRAEIRVNWDELRQEVSRRGLAGRKVKVVVPGEGEVKTKLVRIEEDELVVKANKSTGQWVSAKGEARIPRSSVTALRFSGRQGRGRSIVAAAGLGAGAAIGVGSLLRTSIGGGKAALGIASSIAVWTVVGYFIGRTRDKPIPEFRIVH